MLAMPAGLFAAGLGLGKIVRDCSLTCNVGFQFSPFAILAVAVVSVPLAALSARGERRWGAATWQSGTLLVGAISLVVFRALTLGLLRGHAEPLRWTYLAFYVWVGALSVLLGVNVFSSAFRLFTPLERERGIAVLAPAFATGGLLGSLLAGWSAAWLMSAFGWRYEVVRDNLMLGMAALLLLQVPFVYAIERRRPPPDPVVRMGAGLSGRFAGLLRNRSVVGLVALVALGGVADTALKYLFYWLVSLEVDYSRGRTLYFAGFYSWLNGINLLLLLLGTGRAIRRLGVGLSLVTLPLAMAAGTAVLAMHLAISLMYGLRVVENALRATLYEPALDRALVRIPEHLSERVRPWLKGPAARIGEALGAIVVLGLATSPRFDPAAAALVLLAVLLAWLGAAFVVRPALRADGPC